MSVIITFRNGTDWFRANWVFRQLRDDVLMKFPDEHEMNSELERAQWIGRLALEEMQEGLATRMMEAFQKVAEEVKPQEFGPDDHAGRHDIVYRHNQYVESMKELLELLKGDRNVR